MSTTDLDVMAANMSSRKLAGPEFEKRRSLLREAIAFKDYEFNTHGVELDQRYVSSAIVPDGTPAPSNPRDPELYHHATTWPGAKLPHAWVCRDASRVSTLDLGGHGQFHGLHRHRWLAMGCRRGGGFRPRSGSLSTPSRSVRAADWEDVYGDWAGVREIGDTGCIVARPDNYVCFRSAGAVDDATATLSGRPSGRCSLFNRPRSWWRARSRPRDRRA